MFYCPLPIIDHVSEVLSRRTQWQIVLVLYGQNWVFFLLNGLKICLVKIFGGVIQVIFHAWLFVRIPGSVVLSVIFNKFDRLKLLTRVYFTQFVALLTCFRVLKWANGHRGSIFYRLLLLVRWDFRHHNQTNISVSRTSCAPLCIGHKVILWTCVDFFQFG